MSTDDVPVVQVIDARLRDLLAKAREVKQSTSIEPPLQPADFDDAVAQIAQLHDHHNDSDAAAASTITQSPAAAPQHAALETAARSIFYAELAAHAIDTAPFVAVWNLLDALQFCADAGQCDASLALWLVEELLDSQTIDGCRVVFDYLESRRERLVTRSPSKNKQMIVLRSCNELLRRLSRAEDAVFCGRVFIFLFQSFPLGDKSSVNLRGEFHTENTTVFDEPVAKAVDGEMEGVSEGTDGREADGDGVAVEKMEIDEAVKEEAEIIKEEEKPVTEALVAEKEGEDKDTSTAKVNRDLKAEDEGVDTDALYSTFWSLQHAFSNPTKVFEQEEFDKFKRGLELTIKKFKSMPKVLQTHGTPRTPGEGIKRKRSRADDEFASNFNPKYLTSRDLFELELNDLTFQRHILVQALILIDFFLSLTPKAKKKLVELKAQKAMLYPYTLGEEDTKWATSTRAEIATYLQEGPDGKYYYRMADTVLARDKNWVRWKVESCPPIEKAPTSTEDCLGARTGAKRACTDRRIKATPMGAIDMSFLSDSENVNGLETLRNPERYQPPGTGTFIRDIAGVDLDLDMAADEEKKYLVETRASMTWRVLRIASKSRLNLFDKVDEGKGLDLLSDDPAAEPPDEEATQDSTDPTASVATVAAVLEVPDEVPTITEAVVAVEADTESAPPAEDPPVGEAETPAIAVEPAAIEAHAADVDEEMAAT